MGRSGHHSLCTEIDFGWFFGKLSWNGHPLLNICFDGPGRRIGLLNCLADGAGARWFWCVFILLFVPNFNVHLGEVTDTWYPSWNKNSISLWILVPADYSKCWVIPFKLFMKFEMARLWGHFPIESPLESLGRSCLLLMIPLVCLFLNQEFLLLYILLLKRSTWDTLSIPM